MTNPEEGAPRAADDISHPDGPSDLIPDRMELATKLKKLAKELTTTSRRMKRSWPDRDPKQDVANFWLAGLQEAQGYIDRVDYIQVDCQSIADKELEVSGKEDTALPAIKQLEQAVTEAVGATRAAINTLELADQPFVPQARSDSFMKVADQLAELASRCSGLVVYMLGPDDLEKDSASQNK
jgi:hypothetical protein